MNLIHRACAYARNEYWWAGDREPPRCICCGRPVRVWQSHVYVYVPRYIPGSQEHVRPIHLWHGGVFPEVTDCLTGVDVVLRRRKMWSDYKAEIEIPLRFMWYILREGQRILHHPIRYIKWRQAYKRLGL